MTTRKAATYACRAEAANATAFARAARNNARAGYSAAAWRAADAARCAATCALQAHDALWDAARGQLTDDEWEAFEAAELAQTTTAEAERAAAEAVLRAQAACFTQAAR